VPKVGQWGQLCSRRLITKDYKITKLQLLHNKRYKYLQQWMEDITTRYMNKIYEIQREKINKCLNVRIKRYSKYEDHSHKAKHAPIRIGLLFNGNH
jgi:hypothetical protein